ncbi:LuxR C-terminal-related transcriptional regulator [Blastococcus sp. SYSU D00820]
MRTTVPDVTALAVHVLDAMVAPEFPAGAVLPLLCEAVDAPYGVYQRVAWREGTTELVPFGWSPELIAPLAEATRMRRQEHPLLAAAATGALGPTTAARVCGAAGWRRHPARVFLRDLGGWDQIGSVGLTGGPTVVCGLAFGRRGRDLTDDQLRLLAGVQPLLQAVERHVRLVARWTAAVPDAPERASGTGLTAREAAVLVLLAEGLTAGAVAHRLGCSPRTVEKHTAAVYRKLGVHDRVTAVLRGQRLGVLAPPAQEVATATGSGVPTRSGSTER